METEVPSLMSLVEENVPTNQDKGASPTSI